jgi:hypothetical protein
VAERNEKVLQRVREELSKNPQLGSRELYELAQQVDKGVGQDSLQQFHARYVLPVKRGQRSGEAKPAGRRAGGGAQQPRRGRKGRAQAQTQSEQPSPAEQSGAAPARAPRRARAAAEGADRDNVRTVLLEFARDFSGAESRSEIVQVLSRIDEYVDRIAGNR